jgi:Zn-dependent protease
MIFYLGLVKDDPFAALVFVAAIAVALVAGISFHEFSHAFVADRLGDRLPRSQGRVTLNPLAHLDPTGTLLMVMVGFGWGRPVQINPNATANPKATLGLTSAAGPLSNFIVAAAFGLPLKLNVFPWISPFNTTAFNVLSLRGFTGNEYAGLFLSSIVLFSIILGVFNLIPIAPLDGFKVAIGILPRDMAREFAKLEQYGPLMLIALIANSWRGYSPASTAMSSSDRARYRFRQLRRALRPNVRASDLNTALGVLGERLFPLFDSMQAADQLHCLDVYQRLVKGGCADAEMLQAALIHDAGKGRLAGARFGVRHRVIYVALERTPRLLDRLARHNRGLASLHAHSQKTIALAREYGASPGVVHLLEALDSRDPSDDERARLLKAIDDES